MPDPNHSTVHHKLGKQSTKHTSTLFRPAEHLRRVSREWVFCQVFLLSRRIKRSCKYPFRFGAFPTSGSLCWSFPRCFARPCTGQASLGISAWSSGGSDLASRARDCLELHHACMQGENVSDRFFFSRYWAKRPLLWT